MNPIGCSLIILIAFVLAGCSKSTESTQPTQEEIMANGGQIYAQYCAGCHQPEGGGLPNMQPALMGNAIVAGDPKQLIRVVLQGPATVLPADRPHYLNAMPGFAVLTDQQAADLLTYVRAKFGHNASAIQPQNIAAVRATISN
jgi:mono/diheme cytochrome c family protein